MNVQIDRQVTKLRKLQNQSSIDRSRWARYTDTYSRLILSRLDFFTPKNARQIQNELHSAGYYELNIVYIQYLLWMVGKQSGLHTFHVTKIKQQNGRCSYKLTI